MIACSEAWWSSVLRHCMQSEGDADATEVYLQGTARIMKKPELADVNRMIALFRTFEEKSRLVKILSECLKSNSNGPTVTIGLEKHLPGHAGLGVDSFPLQSTAKGLQAASASSDPRAWSTRRR